MPLKNYYIKNEKGRYEPVGVCLPQDMLGDGIWYVRHTDHSKRVTSIPYLQGLFKVGDKAEIDFPKLCAMDDYVNYVLDSDEFREMYKNGYTLYELLSKVVALIFEFNEKKQEK